MSALMDKSAFWKIIDESRNKANGDLERHLEVLQQQLVKLEPDEIVTFGHLFDEYWHRAYTWELWGAAYIVGGGCSDDGFADFRGWLISKGEKVYEDALKDPDSLITVVKESDDGCQFEGFHYAAWTAWEEITGRDMDEFPHSGRTTPDDPAGERWSEESDDLERLFPKLWRKFTADW
jgi:hypothetical protein